MASSAQHDALRRRTMDVGLLRHVADDPDIQSEPLFAERFVVMVSDNNPLARYKSLHLKQLVNERLLLQDRDWASLAQEKILSLCAAAGVTPRMVTLEAIPGNQASMLAVVSGEAICLALRGANSRSYQPVRGVAVVPLDEPHAELRGAGRLAQGRDLGDGVRVPQVRARVVPGRKPSRPLTAPDRAGSV